MTKKRGQGEGSVFRRKDGLWVAQVTVQAKHISKYFKKQKDAIDWLQDTRNQIQNGLTYNGAQITVGVFLEDWLNSYKSSVRPKTIYQYREIVKNKIIPAIGKIKLKDLRPDKIQYFYNTCLDNGVSERTTLLIHAVLHRALNQALQWGLIGRNPSQAVTRPRYKRKEMMILTGDQVGVFLAAAKETNCEVIYWLAVTTGIREGELLGLKWSDLDWENRRLQIQRQVQRLPEVGVVFSEPKTAAGKRLIVLSATVVLKLYEQKEHQELIKQFAGDRWKENNLIFTSTVGTPVDRRNMYREFKAIIKKAELPDIRFHDLRHTAATLMLQQGVHPKVVQECLGHSDISLTLNTYSHVLPSMQDAAAEKMEELLATLKKKY
jgi:integrase